MEDGVANKRRTRDTGRWDVVEDYDRGWDEPENRYTESGNYIGKSGNRSQEFRQVHQDMSVLGKQLTNTQDKLKWLKSNANAVQEDMEEFRDKTKQKYRNDVGNTTSRRHDVGNMSSLSSSFSRYPVTEEQSLLQR